MNLKSGLFRQRVGALIEKDMCKRFDLFYNNRQRINGYYDGYNKNNLYEIKASNLNYNTFIIRARNHDRLLNSKGSYIFVSYSLLNKDKDLSVISDIVIENIYIISAFNMDIILKKYGNIANKKAKRDKAIIKIKLNYLSEAKAIKNEI